MTIRLKAKLKGYIHGVFYTKFSELENDIPVIETREQDLTEKQKRIARANIDAINLYEAQEGPMVHIDSEIARVLGIVDEKHEDAKEYTDDEISNLKEYTNDEISELEKYTDTEISDLKEYTDGELLDDRDRLTGLENKVGNTPTTLTLTNSVVELFNLAESIDASTLERIDGILRVRGMRKDNRVITVNDISEIETAIVEINQEIDRTLARGGYITPYDFGWDGLGYTVKAGDTFTENRDGVKTTITVVADQDETYPQGIKIGVSQAKMKSMEFQVQLLAWACEDIWGKGWNSYHDVQEIQSAVTLMVYDIQTTTEKVLFESVKYKYVWKQENGVMVFGKMNKGGSVFIERYYEGNEMDIKTFVVDEPTQVVRDDMSGCDFIVWEHNISEIYDGTKVINLYNGWMYQYTPIEWGIANIAEENIKYATNSEGGIVKTQSTTGIEDSKVYGIKLNVGNQMYVDGLGVDIDGLEKAKLDRNEASLQGLYDTLLFGRLG